MLDVYNTFAPRFMAYLEFVAAGREHVIPFLQRWGAGAASWATSSISSYCSSLGCPDRGNRPSADIVARLVHTYGKAVSKGFFMRSMEKRTFELYQTRSRRALFADETPKGGELGRDPDQQHARRHDALG